MQIEQTLVSKIDSSVNFVLDNGLECRYVQRTPEYFIIYVSSQTGCAKACRFCHLTQTKQTSEVCASHAQYLEQVDLVLKHWQETHYADKSKLIKVHVNFMARGEPLSNPVLMNSYKDLFDDMEALITEDTDVTNIRFKISTIIPKDVDKEALLAFNDPRADFYYSLYSTNDKFRKRWLPKALDYIEAIDLLQLKENVTIHHALIKGENDSLEEAKNVAWFASLFDYRPDLNIVMYNPYSPLQGKESDVETVHKYVDFMKQQWGFSEVKIIPRVGLDVHASCGTFVKHHNTIANLKKKSPQ